MRISKVLGASAALALLADPALAHTGLGTGVAVTSGFVHPFSGLDHLLAMVAVGLWAVQLGGRALIALPATFVGAMLVGGFTVHLTRAGATSALPVEATILASVVVLGGIVALKARLATIAAAVVVAMFAVAHGHAHGSEIPVGAAITTYIVGMAAATALLHAAGIVFGLAVSRWPGAQRTAGAVIALTGLGLAFT